MYCIDASVIVSAARGNELYSSKSRAFLDSVTESGAKIILPELAVAEIGWGLFRATKNADFVYDFIFSLRKLSNFTFVTVDSKLVNLALEVITKTGTRSADAIYIALALEYNLTLVTLDREQLSRGRKIVQIKQP